MTILKQIAAGHAPSIVPLTVDQYHEMISRGILREGEPIELIDGILVRKDRADRGGDPMSHGPRHAAGVKRLQRPFRKVEDWGLHLHSQLPVTLGATQEPEPDLAIVRGSPEDYADRHPQAAEIVAVMEVADSSLAYDRTTKLSIYSRANIPIYWIVNLVDKQIEVYESPQASTGQYGVRTDYLPLQTVRLNLGADMEIAAQAADIIVQ